MLGFIFFSEASDIVFHYKELKTLQSLFINLLENVFSWQQLWQQGTQNDTRKELSSVAVGNAHKIYILTSSIF